jgi:hypothetical protein
MYLDRTFNLVDYLQSQDRIHRISQTRPCEIVLLLSNSTVDDFIDFSLEQKHRLARFTQKDAGEIGPGDLGRCCGRRRTRHTAGSGTAAGLREFCLEAHAKQVFVADNCSVFRDTLAVVSTTDCSARAGSSAVVDPGTRATRES